MSPVMTSEHVPPLAHGISAQTARPVVKQIGADCYIIADYASMYCTESITGYTFTSVLSSVAVAFENT